MSLKETFLISPLSVSNCQLWLDGADPNGNGVVPANGATVSTWVDKSGNSRNTSSSSGTSTLVRNGINQKPAVSFNSTSFTGPFSYTGTQLHCFAVITMANNGINARVLSVGNASQTDFGVPQTAIPLCRGGSGTTDIITVRNNTNAIVSFGSYNTPFLVVSAQYASTQEISVNGSLTPTATSSGTSAAFNTTTYGLGVNTGTVGEQSYVGYIGEIILYNSYLSTSQRQRMEGYLAWKWGLQTSLPTNHPYRSSRPLDGISLPTSLLVPSRPLRNIPNSLFNPTEITNCTLWLDGADRSTMFQNTAGTLPVSGTGSTVALWRDKSASANHASNTSAQPTVTFAGQNGLNVVNFTGSQYLTLTPSLMPTGSTQFTFFSIFRTTSTNTQVYLTWGNTQDALGFGRAPQLYITNYTLANDTYGAGGTTDTTVYNSVYVMNSMTADTRNNGWDNGTPFNNTNNTAITLNTGTTFAYIGTGQVNGSLYAPFYLIGQIAELVGFSRSLSTAERQRMEGYLAWKWGIQTNLPSSHPYRLNPPDLPVQAPRGIALATERFFNPRNITGIQLWLDVMDKSSLTLVGSSVSQLNDKSGNNYNATQSVAASRPTLLSNNLIQFANNTYFDFSQSAINNTTIYSLFLIFNPIASVNWIIQKQYNGVGSYNMLSMTNYWQNNTGVTNYLYWGPHANTGVVNAGTALSLNTLQMIELQFNGSILSFYRNGILLNTATSGPTLTIVNQTNATNCTIGSWRPDGGIQNSGVTNFYMGELIYHNVSFSTSQRQAIEGYLAWKWGIQANLPSTHPFKLFPPSP